MDSPQQSSRLKGFYKLKRSERLETLEKYARLSAAELHLLADDGALPFEICDALVENALGAFPLPLGLMTYLKVNQRDYLVPMAVEESSVIAAASNAAKSIYESGGFEARCLSHLMIGQIQLLDISPEDFTKVQSILTENKSRIIAEADRIHPRLKERGGGVKDLEVRCFPEAEIPFIVLHILIDPCDAMGANLVNTACEKLAPMISEMTGARIGLRILSNLADQRLYQASCSIPVSLLGVKNSEYEFSGEEVAQRIYEAFVFADTDPYRATTHNKGIMNGVDPVVIATGNDWRAVEAGAHAFAARTGRYRSLSSWKFCKTTQQLKGELTLPLQIGTVGGVTKLNPVASLVLKMMDTPSADQLSQIMVCAGLASNLAALRALVTTGIQSGHMRLHAKNLALSVGAEGHEVNELASWMIDNKNINALAAEAQLDRIRNL